MSMHNLTGNYWLPPHARTNNAFQRVTYAGLCCHCEELSQLNNSEIVLPGKIDCSPWPNVIDIQISLSRGFKSRSTQKSAYQAICFPFEEKLVDDLGVGQ